MFERWRAYLFPHRGMKKVMVHDGCGGWLAYVQFSMKESLWCTECHTIFQDNAGSLTVNFDEKWHYEWRPKEEVDKFYAD